MDAVDREQLRRACADALGQENAITRHLIRVLEKLEKGVT